MVQSIENKILNKVRKCGRGSVFFSSSFISLGNQNSVNKALERMTKDGTVIRVARGMYCYPKIEKVYGLGPIFPSPDEIADAVAKKDGAKIIPAGTYAQYQLGLSQQIPLNTVFLTDGTSRTLKITDGRTIVFKHASPRYFVVQDKLALMLMSALKDWKLENISEQQRAQLKKIVNSHPHFQTSDLKLMPVQTREFIIRLYE